jgi:hypothetical protein
MTNRECKRRVSRRKARGVKGNRRKGKGEGKREKKG